MLYPDYRAMYTAGVYGCVRFVPHMGPDAAVRERMLHRFLTRGTEEREKVASWDAIIPPQRVFGIKGFAFPPRSVSQREYT